MEIDAEIWKDIPGYEGLYQVSSLGRVKSLDRILPHNTHGTWHLKERVLKQRPSLNHNGGYMEVFLHSGHGISKCVKVHRLVAESFVPNFDNLPQVNHIDGNKANNRADNLEWVTGEGNMKHAWSTGLCANIVKAKQRPVINTDTGERFNSLADAERSFGTSFGGISHVLNGKCETSHGYHWAYADTEGR